MIDQLAWPRVKPRSTKGRAALAARGLDGESARRAIVVVPWWPSRRSTGRSISPPSIPSKESPANCVILDAEAQIIVAQEVTQSTSDCVQLLLMTDAVDANLGRKAKQVSADAGYCSRKILPGLRPVQSTPMWRPAGRRTLVPARRGVRLPRAVHNSAGRNTDARRSQARQDQGRRRQQPLPAAQATAWAGFRTDQTGARISPILVARLRRGVRRVGSYLHRPQSVRSTASALPVG